MRLPLYKIPMKLIALKIDVDTMAAITVGVPRLQQILSDRQCGATFFWSLGVEKKGTLLWPARGLRRFHGMGLLPLKARFGLKALCRGSLLPASRLTKSAVNAIRTLNSPAFEHGVRPERGYDWLRDIRAMLPLPSESELKKTLASFARLTGVQPKAFSALAWQSNRAVYRAEQMAGLDFASDTRGYSPFFPVINGEPVRCVQLPVSLPMFEEAGRATCDELVDALLQETQSEPPAGHVFNIAADFDAIQYAEQLTRLLDGWLAQGYQLVSLGTLYQQLNLADLAYHEITQAECSGRIGLLATQGRQFPH